MSISCTLQVQPALNQFVAGQTVLLVARFFTAAGAPTAPTDPQILISKPDGTQQLSVLAALTLDADGSYSLVLQVNIPGVWNLMASCTAPSTASATTSFNVVASSTTSIGSLPAQVTQLDGLPLVVTPMDGTEQICVLQDDQPRRMALSSLPGGAVNAVSLLAVMTGLPTVQPITSGILWLNEGYLCVS